MEKRTPSCKLTVVKALIAADKVNATRSARDSANLVGIHDLRGMCDVVMGLTTTDFYKSMTTHADNRVWQDVYHCSTADGIPLYVKLTVIDDVLIVSFKEL
ncbi:type II toxin-antitoxin system MqsR family toxin [Pseudoduganella lutea]|uniref:Type II toxin-antitoxin system MqsR family toxin n=1 Tax=Pseudoduganella lutea TaxID=321985 RepID=A0A4P6KXA8_9BURK|nr:type II toxin-antitoxin system MqsR family toxin [Pseudoduganella lutea]QBE63172.1 type II toxin-antitoxin system MqsR family toxin [Pseudoduganella lutea]